MKIQFPNTRGNILKEDLTGIDTKPEDVKGLMPDLIRLAKEKHGAAIAANQLGIRQNFFFAAVSAKFPSKRGGKPVAHMCIQPKWRPREGTKKAVGEEGCLSLPGRVFEVERYVAIDAEWINAVGHPQKMRMQGWAARVFQHECDHLRGVTLLESGKEIKDTK